MKHRSNWIPIAPGERYGRYTILELLPENRVRVRCDCGTEKDTQKRNVIRGAYGCIRCLGKVRPPPNPTTHGYTAHGVTARVYRIWADMRNRCNNPNLKCYYRYGGAGITYDPRYDSFEEFIKDMGEPPTNRHTVNRIDGTLGYFKGNMNWITPFEQARNRKTNVWAIVNGERMIVKDAARVLGIGEQALRGQLKKGTAPCSLASTG